MPDSDWMLPELDSADIVKLYAATFLPLCEALGEDGLLDRPALAGRLKRCADMGSGSWSDVVRALAVVLERPAAPRAIQGLTVIQGGLSGGKPPG